MKAILKNIYSIETNCKLDEFHPDDPFNFCISIKLIIGLENIDNEESFDITVCTPEWLREQCEKRKYEWGRHFLFVHEYNFHLIKKIIIEYIDRCAGDDWNAIANKISRIASWEFEDYQEMGNSK